APLVATRRARLDVERLLDSAGCLDAPFESRTPLSADAIREKLFRAAHDHRLARRHAPVRHGRAVEEANLDVDVEVVSDAEMKHRLVLTEINRVAPRSEEHTSELKSRENLVW